MLAFPKHSARLHGFLMLKILILAWVEKIQSLLSKNPFILPSVLTHTERETATETGPSSLSFQIYSLHSEQNSDFWSTKWKIAGASVVHSQKWQPHLFYHSLISICFTAAWMIYTRQHSLQCIPKGSCYPMETFEKWSIMKYLFNCIFLCCLLVRKFAWKQTLCSA